MMAISRAVLFSRTMNFDCNIHNEEEGGEPLSTSSIAAAMTEEIILLWKK
jgi:hypothetical protein